MKKFLLLCLPILSAVPSFGSQLILDGLQVRKISPAAKYAASDGDDGLVRVLDIDAGVEVMKFGSENGYPYFFMGYGNPISDTGILVGQFGGSEYDGAVYADVVSGQMVKLPTLNEWGGDQAMGITPDGSVICGYIIDPYAVPGEGLFKIPVIWERNSDGSYGDYKVLPYPEKDWTGRTPWHVEAHWISDDGCTVIGRLTDAFGLMRPGESVGWPILFSKESDGEWSCSMIGEELLNPSGVVLPDYPENTVSKPEMTDFMTQEEYKEYRDAYMQYLNGELADPPQVEDFMSEDGKADYEAAMEVYEEYLSLVSDFAEAYALAIEGMPEFYYLMSLSPDGRYAGCFSGTIDMSTGNNVGVPYIFDLENGSYRCVTEPENIILTQIADNGDALGYMELNGFNQIAYIVPDGSETGVRLYDWLLQHDAETASWMEENMTHTIMLPESDGSYVPLTDVISGAVCANSDFSVMASWTIDTWDEENLFGKLSYIFGVDDNSVGVEELENNDDIFSEMNAEEILIYTTDGIFIEKTTDRNSLRNLPRGMYVLRSGNKAFKHIIRD